MKQNSTINHLEYKFSIKRVLKTTDDEYIQALKIYNDTTPFEIKTPTNEITYWLNKQKTNTPFEMHIFVLYLNTDVIGFAMTTYIKRTKIVVDEYLSVYEQYRIQTIFLVYESLIQNFYREATIEVAYFLTEISNKADGKEMDRESKISLKLLCIEEYGKIDALYYALPLGMENHESNFPAYIYIKGVDSIKSISLDTYKNIIKSIYYDYWITWYSAILSENELNSYKTLIDKNFELIEKSLNNDQPSLLVSYNSCDSIGIDNTVIRKPIPATKQTKYASFLIMIPIVIISPLLIIWIYNKLLELMGLSMLSLSTMIGTIIGTIITTLVTLYIAIKKL